MLRDHWSGTVDGRPVMIRVDQDQNVVISTTLARDELHTPGGMVAPRLKGEPIDLQPDDGKTCEQTLLEHDFTPQQAAAIVARLPVVLEAK